MPRDNRDMLDECILCFDEALINHEGVLARACQYFEAGRWQSLEGTTAWPEP